MKKDSIFALGCSLMYGTDHVSTNGNTRPSEQVYTKLVAEHYGLKHYNFSMSGSSNQNIFRQVFVAEKFAKENKLNPIFWIGWTKYTHLALASMNTVNKSKGWPYVNVHSEVAGYSNDLELTKWAKEVYKNLDKFSRFTLSVNSIVQANLFLQSKGITAINTFNSATWQTGCPRSTFYIQSTDKESQELMKDYLLRRKGPISAEHLKHKIQAGVSGESFKDFDPYARDLWEYMKSFGWFEWGKNDLGFQMWVRQKNLPLLPDHTAPVDNISFHHPGEKAHAEASKKIIKSKLLETLNETI